MIKTLAHKPFYIKKHAVGENRREKQNLSGILFASERLVRVFSTQQHIVDRQSAKHRLGYIFINQLTKARFKRRAIVVSNSIALSSTSARLQHDG